MNFIAAIRNTIRLEASHEEFDSTRLPLFCQDCEGKDSTPFGADFIQDCIMALCSTNPRAAWSYAWLGGWLPTVFMPKSNKNGESAAPSHKSSSKSIFTRKRYTLLLLLTSCVTGYLILIES